jgi:tetratricopeptide (TPR) repeat protein
MNKLPDYKRSDDTAEVGTLINTGIDKCVDLKYGEGITEFNKALELDPENFDALYNKAVALLKWVLMGSLSEVNVMPLV